MPSGHLSALVSRWGVPQEKISLIRNSQLIPEDKPNFEKTFDAICVGRLIPLKGNAELISVCAKSGYSLRVLGEGPQEEELRTLAYKLGGKIDFLGSLTNSEVLNQIRGSRVFVLNSAHEGSPNALIEAMAQGAVCVVRSNPGTNELVRDLKNGILVSNERSLDEALRMAIQDKELRKELSEEAYRFAKSELNQELNFKRILHACI